MTTARGAHHPQEGDGQQGEILLNRPSQITESSADSSIDRRQELGFLINDCLSSHA